MNVGWTEMVRMSRNRPNATVEPVLGDHCYCTAKSVGQQRLQVYYNDTI